MPLGDNKEVKFLLILLRASYPWVRNPDRSISLSFSPAEKIKKRCVKIDFSSVALFLKVVTRRN